jgi:hypothetical protein
MKTGVRKKRSNSLGYFRILIAPLSHGITK